MTRPKRSLVLLAAYAACAGLGTLALLALAPGVWRALPWPIQQLQPGGVRFATPSADEVEDLQAAVGITALGTPGPPPTVSLTPVVAGPGRFFPSQGHCHIGQTCPPDAEYDTFTYTSDPPTSGPHVERFPMMFVSSEPLPKAILVHMLEHTNVLLLYNRNATPGVVGRLRTYAESYDDRYLYLQTPTVAGPNVSDALQGVQGVFVAPYPGMEHTIALTAWTRLDTFDAYDQARIDRFVRAWLGNVRNARQ